MTKLDERVSLEIEQELKALFEESVPCDITNHGTRTEVHDGSGEWYMIYTICETCCGDELECLSICDKFKNHVEKNKATIEIPCSGCDTTSTPEQMNVRFEKRGK